MYLATVTWSEHAPRHFLSPYAFCGTWGWLIDAMMRFELVHLWTTPRTPYGHHPRFVLLNGGHRHVKRIHDLQC